MTTTSQEEQIERLLRDGFVLKRDFRSCTLNDKEITNEEYDELWNRVLIYLDNNCEKVDEYDYGVEDLWWCRIGLYKCNLGKVGLFIESSEGYDRFRVYVGDDAWKQAKEEAIDDVQNEIEFLEPKEGTDELIEYLNNVLDEIKHMPE
jgi:hypothetical protein